MNITGDKEYLVALLKKIIFANGSEDELEHAIYELKRISSISEVTDLIFYPEKVLGG